MFSQQGDRPATLSPYLTHNIKETHDHWQWELVQPRTRSPIVMFSRDYNMRIPTSKEATLWSMNVATLVQTLNNNKWCAQLRKTINHQLVPREKCPFSS
jgi:hypothetical protein